MRAKKVGHLPTLPEGQNTLLFITMTETERKDIVNEITGRVSISMKPILTSQEAAAYLGISMSKLYKLTCQKEIPHYKPNGKLNYFEREEIEAWALRNRIATNAEISDQALALSRR